MTPSDPPIQVTLADGQTVNTNLESVVALWSALPELIRTGEAARARHRMSMVVDPVSVGLVAISKENGPDSWCLPGGYGKLPLGVPVLQFISANPNLHYLPWDSPGDDLAPREEHWRVVFSGMPGSPLYEAAWNDEDGIQTLMDALHQDYDVLATHAALAHPQAVAEMSDSDRWSEAVALARHLLDVGSTLPDLEDDLLAAVEKTLGATVSPVLVVDPDLCRYVNIPGLARVSRPGSMRVKQFDKDLSSLGVMSLPGSTGNTWMSTDRIVVAKGYRARVGSMNGPEWRIMPAPNIGGFANMFHGFLPPHRNGSAAITVTLTEPLTLDERLEILERQV